MTIINSRSESETLAAAKEFAKKLSRGSVVAFRGELGAGKTVFIRGICEYFGADSEIASPTYTLLNQYDGSPPICHFDVYRIENADDETSEWMDEYLFGDGICLIEWADNIRSILPENTIWIEINKNIKRGEDFREIRICGYSE